MWDPFVESDGCIRELHVPRDAQITHGKPVFQIKLIGDIFIELQAAPRTVLVDDLIGVVVRIALKVCCGFKAVGRLMLLQMP